MYTTRPAEFTYHRPSTVDEAVALLAELDESRPLAGGHSLLPAMKLRFSTPGALVDIGRIPELSAIERDGGAIRIGATATHAAIASSDLVRAGAAALADAASMIGDRQVRNRGTIGGSLAHSDPGADYPTVVSALGATIVTAGPNGSRELAAGNDFFTGLFTTALEPGELITSVRVPTASAGTGTAYVKHKHPASGYAVAGAAAAVTVEGGACTSARLVVGGVTGAPVEIPVGSLTGTRGATEELAAAAAAVPGSLAGVIGDTYASAEYRTHLATVLAKRSLAKAFERAAP
jgi:carbon-monoxide dehydrogenase medium subunit